MTHDSRLLPFAACLLAILAVAAPADNAPGVVRFDFETADLQGWRVIEGAFGKLLCDRAAFHHTGEPYNKQGRYFLSTLDQPDGPPNDTYTGVVESPVFVLTAPDMSFLIGGGHHRDTYVALCAFDGEEVFTAHGIDSQTMQRVKWQAPDLVGRPVFLRLVDANTGGWGHVTFDDFIAQGALDPAATAANFARKKTVLDDVRNAGLPAPGSPATLRAALLDLLATFGDRYPHGQEFLARLDDVEKIADERQARARFLSLQREALLANPLVRDHPLLYVVRPQYVPDHHNTETMFQTGEINTGSFRGGGALKVLDLSRGPDAEPRVLLAVPTGIARDPEVHFSGHKILFSMRRKIDDDYHLYEIDADGANLRQLTFAPGVTDIDPLYLPDDTVAFTSTREPKYCMCNRHIMGNLFTMDADGANIHQLGRNTLMDGQGSLTPDGRILYQRWEYIDRNFGDAQGLWTVNPDGTNHAVYWGNNTSSPGAVLDPRLLPGSAQVVCTFGSCHDRPWGALAIVDRRLAMDGRAAVIRTWPAEAIDRVDRGGFDSYVDLFPKYEDPYPLADPDTDLGGGKYFLCSRMIGRGEQMGIYLLDVFGNEVLVHAEEPGCFDPMPLSPRPRPAVLPPRRDFADDVGRFYVLDVYQGTHMAGVKRGAARFLRVIESGQKRSWVYPWWMGQGSESPAMNWHDFGNKRILGTVPVEPDGSAYCTVPSDRFVYFQLLDENGMMIQSMRSATMVQSGETAGCIGCHESRVTAPPAATRAMPIAVARPPSKLAGEPRFFSYMADVQPVFDRLCVSCHDYGKPAGARLNLARDRDLVFNASYNELWRKSFVGVVGAGPPEIQAAYSWGSHASPLIKKILSGHPAALAPEDFARIVTWIDLNAPYYPSYDCAYADNLAGRSPLNDQQLKRLSELTGIPFADQASCSANPGPQISFERPEISPCLARLADKASAEYREALAIIQAGKAMLASKPEADMPGFVACPVDQRREGKYAERQGIEARNRAALREGRKLYDTPPR
jgi:hypothetical protein